MPLRRDRRPFERIRGGGGGGAEGVVQAPVGHRQPRAGLPNEKNLIDPNDPLSKENAALDCKIKSICRGCWLIALPWRSHAPECCE
jgi:hypothetical protein